MLHKLKGIMILNLCISAYTELLLILKSPILIATGGLKLSLIDLSITSLLRVVPIFLTPIGILASAGAAMYGMISIRYNVGIWTRNGCM